MVICNEEYFANVADVAPALPALKTILCDADVLPESADLAARILLLRDHRGDCALEDWEVAPSSLSCSFTPPAPRARRRGCMVSQNYICSQGLQCNDAVPPEPGEVMWHLSTAIPRFGSEPAHCGACGQNADRCIAPILGFGFLGRDRTSGRSQRSSDGFDLPAPRLCTR